MKRLICVLLSVMMLATLFAGCGAAEEPNSEPGKETITDTPSPKPEGDSQKQPESTGDKESSDTKEEKQILEVPFKTVTAECGADRVVREEGFATVVYESKDAMVAFCMDVINTYDIELEEVLSVYEKRVPAVVSTMCQGDINGQTIEMLNSEKVKMAGFDSIRFTGKVANTAGWDCHVYGYLFLIDNDPYAVMGIVSQKDQNADLIAANEAEVDEIAATIKKG